MYTDYYLSAPDEATALAAAQVEGFDLVVTDEEGNPRWNTAPGGGRSAFTVTRGPITGHVTDDEGNEIPTYAEGWYGILRAPADAGVSEWLALTSLTVEEGGNTSAFADVVPGKTMADLQAEAEAAEEQHKENLAKQRATELAQRKAADELLDTLPDEEVETLTYLYPRWEPGMVTAAHDASPETPGHRKVRHKGVLYKVNQGHTTQADWPPDETPAVFTRYRDPAAGPQPWVQPIGSHDTYGAGAVVTHNGQTWDNTHGAGNSWEPGVYGWTARP